MRFRLRPPIVLTFLALVLGSPGCGPRKFPVYGKVTYNDAVLENYEGTIVFVGPSGQQADGKINPDGSYRVEGVVEGTNKVSVTYLNPKHEKATRPRPGETPKTSPPPNLTPEAYMDPSASGLTVTVDKETEYNPKLTGPPIK
jgi:hypothetical protein